MHVKLRKPICYCCRSNDVIWMRCMQHHIVHTYSGARITVGMFAFFKNLSYFSSSSFVHNSFMDLFMFISRRSLWLVLFGCINFNETQRTCWALALVSATSNYIQWSLIALCGGKCNKNLQIFLSTNFPIKIDMKMQQVNLQAIVFFFPTIFLYEQLL